MGVREFFSVIKTSETRSGGRSELDLRGSERSTAMRGAPIPTGGSPEEQTEGSVSKSNQPLFLEPKNLSFPGVTVVGGTILNFLIKNTGAQSSAIWIALAVAVAFGGFLIFLGLSDKQNRQPRLVQVFIGIVNTALLWILLFGVSSL